MVQGRTLAQDALMQIISIVSPKGGTGKTALATALAVALAGRECRTCLYDLDPQGSAARWYFNHRLPRNARSMNGSGTWPDRPLDPLVMNRIADPARAAASILKDVEASEEAGRPLEWAVCDTAGGAFGTLGELAVLSDLLVVPLLPSVPDLATIPKLHAFTASLETSPEVAAVLTRVPPRSGQRTEFARQTLADAGLRCLAASIGQSVLWQDAYEAGRSPQEMPFWRSRRAAGEIARLLDEIITMTSSTERKSHGRHVSTETAGGAQAVAR